MSHSRKQHKRKLPATNIVPADIANVTESNLLSSTSSSTGRSKSSTQHAEDLLIKRSRITRKPTAHSISVSDSESAGMTHTHSLRLSKYASANDVIVMWRPINKNAANLLDRASNPYKGKGLNTKGKSSEFGPIAGDIPCLAALSKLASTDPERIPEFEKRTKKL